MVLFGDVTLKLSVLTVIMKSFTLMTSSVSETEQARVAEQARMAEQARTAEQARAAEPEEEEEEVLVNPAETRSLTEEASVLQDELDRLALINNMNLDGGVFMNPGGPNQNQPGGGSGRRPALSNLAEGGPGGRKDDQEPRKSPSKKRRVTGKATKKKTKPPSQIVPEFDWPKGYTKEQIDERPPEQVEKILERQQKDRKLTGKEAPLPGMSKL